MGDVEGHLFRRGLREREEEMDIIERIFAAAKGRVEPFTQTEIDSLLEVTRQPRRQQPGDERGR